MLHVRQLVLVSKMEQKIEEFSNKLESVDKKFKEWHSMDIYRIS